MKHMSPENFGHAEPISLQIRVGEKSHEHNESHRRYYDDEEELPSEDEPSEDEYEEALIEDSETPLDDPAPRWDSELIADSVEDEPNESEVAATGESFESIEDGAFMISAEIVRQYGLKYPGGYMAFEKDFQAKWVQPIQNPLGEEVQSKKKEKNKMDVFTQFSHVTLEEFNEVVKLDDGALDEYLAEHHMDKDDFENWKLVIKYWEDADDLAFDNDTLVADIAKGAFAAELEKEKVQ